MLNHPQSHIHGCGKEFSWMQSELITYQISEISDPCLLLEVSQSAAPLFADCVCSYDGCLYHRGDTCKNSHSHQMLLWWQFDSVGLLLTDSFFHQNLVFKRFLQSQSSAFIYLMWKYIYKFEELVFKDSAWWYSEPHVVNRDHKILRLL